MAPHKDKPVTTRPVKRFFVDMLTRDIALEDAILDLLDNCVDGILRNIGNRARQRPGPRDIGQKFPSIQKDLRLRIIAGAFPGRYTTKPSAWAALRTMTTVPQHLR